MSGLTLPDSPAGRQAAWFLGHSTTAGRDLTVEEIAEHMTFHHGGSPEQALERFRSEEGRPYTVTKVTEESPCAVAVTFDYGDDRPWKVDFWVEDSPPHRITRVFWTRAIPDDVVIRPAAASDGAALNELEVQAPMQLGPLTVVYDRGEDFLGFGRLMGDNICFVAERDGRLLGLACGALHPVRIGGEVHRVMLLHHLRVPVEHRKGGIFSTLNGQVFAAFDARSQGAYGYTALSNAEGLRIGGPGTWGITVYRALLPCAELAGPAYGRWAAGPEDGAAIVSILNEAHDREEAYLPYTEESLAERLARAPELYTWSQLLVGDGAALGVWPAGLKVTTTDEAGTVTTACRAVVLDHGFVPGAEASFEALLRSWCARLVELGHSELMLVLSEGSPGYGLVSKLAARMDPFSFRMSVPEPEGTRERGLYVDAIYF